MDIKTLRSKTEKGIEKELETLENKLVELNFKLSSNQLKNVREVRKVRKMIARIKTVLAEKAKSSETK